MKRAFDIFVVCTLILPFLVAVLCVAFAIWLGDRGPIFYRQKRVGRGTKTFDLLKFRTMVVNADKLGIYQTAENDSRITKVGNFLRRTSLDELPQLLNVLLGDMSLVGPRPDVPQQETLYSECEWQARHIVRPGITGLAQASGRSNIDFETRKRLDLDYVSRATLWLDLMIIFRTVGVLRKGV